MPLKSGGVGGGKENNQIVLSADKALALDGELDRQRWLSKASLEDHPPCCDREDGTWLSV